MEEYEIPDWPTAEEMREPSHIGLNDDDPPTPTHGAPLLAELDRRTAERDSWRRVSERLEREKAAALDEVKRLNSAKQSLLTRLHDKASNDHTGRACDFADLLTRARLERDKAVAEAAELQVLFDLQWTRTQAATALWRQESPEDRANVMPDLGNLLGWFLHRDAVSRAKLAEVADALTVLGDCHVGTRVRELLAEQQRLTADLTATREAVAVMDHERESIRLRLQQAFGVEGCSLASLLAIAELAWQHGQEHKANADRLTRVVAEVETWRWVNEPGDAHRALYSILAAVDAPTPAPSTGGGDR